MEVKITAQQSECLGSAAKAKMTTPALKSLSTFVQQHHITDFAITLTFKSPIAIKWRETMLHSRAVTQIKNIFFFKCWGPSI